MATLPELLKTLVEMDGSDLHITTDTPPQVRVHGDLQRLQLPELHAGRDQAARLQRAHRRAEEALRGDDWSSTSRSASAASRASAATSSTSAAPSAPSTGSSPRRSARFGELGLPPVLANARRPPARPGARHRARPAAASRRRWRRCSTRSTPSATSTSSRSRIRSSTSTSTRTAW